MQRVANLAPILVSPKTRVSLDLVDSTLAFRSLELAANTLVNAKSQDG